MNTNLNLVTAWNTLWKQLTSWAPGLGTVLAVLGLGIIAWFVVKWLWDKRRGGQGGGGGFPTMALILGLVLAGPTVTLPIVLSIAQVIFVIFANLINWFTQTIA